MKPKSQRTGPEPCGWFIAVVLLSGALCEAPLNAAEKPAGRVPQSTNAVVQGEINLLQKLKFEADPNKRPLVLSQRAGTRKEWLDKVMAAGYTASGQTNRAWDEKVKAAFAGYVAYSRERQMGVITQMVDTTSAALKAGCNDAMIRYMDARYRLGFKSDVGFVEYAVAMIRAEKGMIESRYHPILKFIAGFRACQAAEQADENGNRNPLVIFTTEALEDLARDTNAPVDEVFDSIEDLLAYSSGKAWLEFLFSDLEKILEKHWGKEERYFRLRGGLELDRGWNERGGGFANTVTREGWKGFEEHLNLAETYLNKAWQMNSNISKTAYNMMRLELAQGRGRPIMEKWFNCAMALNTNDNGAVSLMAFYLEPRWYGSDLDTLEFGRACVASTNWGGSVPLQIVFTHQSLARYYKKENSPEYWHRPQVWKDLHAAYEKYFRLNPENVGWRHDYARDAYRCGHYSEFLDQTKLFSTGTNFEFFGGEKKLRDMLDTAKAAEASK